jgi:hypothetical protein
LLNLADQLILQESVDGKLPRTVDAARFLRHAPFNERIKELIGELPTRRANENMQQEFALLVAGWPQSREDRPSWTAELLVGATANILEGIVSNGSVK